MDLSRVFGGRIAAKETGPGMPSRPERLLTMFEKRGKGWFWETRADGVLTYLSESILRQINKPHVLGAMSLTEIVSMPESTEQAVSERSLSFSLASRLPFEDRVLKVNTSTEIWCSLSGEPVHDESGRFFGYVGFASDLTEQRRSEIELQHLARFDSLTGLANRDTMRRALENSMTSAEFRKRRCATLILDLDRFKAVNDTFGHLVGDRMLKMAADRLSSAVGTDGLVGRLGGDEFQAVFADIYEEEKLGSIANRVISSISQPYNIHPHTLSVGASIGIAITDYDDRTAVDLLRDADLALYAAKNAGRGTYKIFAPEMHTEARTRQSLENDLLTALNEGQLEVYFQPFVHAKTEALSGFEALVRWTHPVRGAVSPALFIPIAEEIGLINQIGEWVLRTACIEAAKWPSAITVAVNISPVQFSDKALPSLVSSALASAGLPANRLELEITEGVLLDENANVRKMIDRLKNLGVKLSLDDFGTGYSSLGYLKTVPFDKIKIDQSFIKGATLPNSKNVAIIRAIVGLAAELGMNTTAEGVETHDELELSRQLGCTLIQGYIFGRPMDAESALAATGSLSPTANGYAQARSARRLIMRTGLISTDDGQEPIRLKNVSSEGAMIETTTLLHCGDMVKVDLYYGELIDAEVRWVKGKQVGLKFAAPIDEYRLFAQKPKSVRIGHVIPEFLASEKHPNSPHAVQKERLTPKSLYNK